MTEFIPWSHTTSTIIGCRYGRIDLKIHTRQNGGFKMAENKKIKIKKVNLTNSCNISHSYCKTALEFFFFKLSLKSMETKFYQNKFKHCIEKTYCLCNWQRIFYWIFSQGLVRTFKCEDCGTIVGYWKVKILNFEVRLNYYDGDFFGMKITYDRYEI